MTEYFDESVAYLEDEDFSGKKLNVKTGKPVIIILQGSFCGYCKQMKPAFQSMAKKMKGKVVCATIQIDGNPSEKKLAAKIKDLMPVDYQGVPMVVAYKGGNFTKEYKGDRSEQSLLEFANSL